MLPSDSQLLFSILLVKGKNVPRVPKTGTQTGSSAKTEQTSSMKKSSHAGVDSAPLTPSPRRRVSGGLEKEGREGFGSADGCEVASGEESGCLCQTRLLRHAPSRAAHYTRISTAPLLSATHLVGGIPLAFASLSLSPDPSLVSTPTPSTASPCRTRACLRVSAHLLQVAPRAPGVFP